jgi:DNA-binding response OmpR family regulator
MGETPHVRRKVFLLNCGSMKENHIKQTGASASAALQCPANPPQRILVVEDDADIRQLNTEVLTESGFQVDAAQDGVAAWQALNSEHYDLMITDNNMPIVTGLELIKKLRAEDMTLPVILMSGTMPTEELEQHPWLQIQATLIKPYTLAELFKTVKEVLGATSDAHEQKTLPLNWQRLPPTVSARL